MPTSSRLALFKLLESLSESAWQQDLATGRTWVSLDLWRELGYDADLLPLTRRALRELLHPLDASLAPDEVALHIDSDEPFDLEIRIVGLNGQWHWLRLRGCVTLWSDGHPRCIGGIIEDITHAVIAARDHSGAEALIATLSSRERQVLNCLVAGLANKMIAYRLGISQRTIEGYRARLMDKLRVRGAGNLVQVALAGGVIRDSAAAACGLTIQSR